MLGSRAMRFDADPRPTTARPTWERTTGFALAAVAVVWLPLMARPGGGDHAFDVAVVTLAAILGAIAGYAYLSREHDAARGVRVRLVAHGLVRFVLAFELVGYGLAKIVGMQFCPRYTTLDARFVDLGKSSVAWGFFGASYGYQAFTGVAEIAGAVLVCFRRTTTLGASLLVAVMVNVVLVNFFYDVHVKLGAVTYLVMAAYLVALDRERLYVAFVGSASPPSPNELSTAPLLLRRRWLAGLAIVAVLGVPSAFIVREAAGHGLFRPDVLEGAYAVDRRVGLDDLVAPASGERLYLEKGDYGSLRSPGRIARFTCVVDAAASTIRLEGLDRPGAPPLEARFSREGHRLTLEGARLGVPWVLEMTRVVPK